MVDCACQEELQIGRRKLLGVMVMFTFIGGWGLGRPEGSDGGRRSRRPR